MKIVFIEVVISIFLKILNCIDLLTPVFQRVFRNKLIGKFGNIRIFLCKHRYGENNIQSGILFFVIVVRECQVKILCISDFHTDKAVVESVDVSA